MTYLRRKTTKYDALDTLPKIKRAIHELIDPMWVFYGFDRSDIYRQISKAVGYEFHCANIKSVEDGKVLFNLIRDLTIKMNFERKVNDPKIQR